MLAICNELLTGFSSGMTLRQILDYKDSENGF